MVVSEFLSYVSTYKWATYVGMEDYADKLSFNISTPMLLLMTIIVSVKSYILEAISCYIPVKPSGKQFSEYLKSYCWVHGTIPMKHDAEWPDNEETWAVLDRDGRINYYQWVPFMLALQAILFYLPRLIWQSVTYNLSGADLEGLINMANDASNTSGEDRKSVVSQIAQNLESLLFDRRNIPLHSNRVAQKASSVMNSLCSGKRSGRRLVFQYMLIKILYLINVIGQLFLMQKFLGLKSTNAGNFGYVVLNNIINGVEWNQTLMFPRVSYCYVNDVQHVGMSNAYMAQCVLPINMLNEKIYIFLWFWSLLVLTVTVISFVQWLVRIFRLDSRERFLRKFLKIKEVYKGEEKQLLKLFTSSFLRGDGVFILRMLAINAGDLIATDIISELWKIFKDNRSNDAFNKSSPPASEASTLPLKQDFV